MGWFHDRRSRLLLFVFIIFVLLVVATRTGWLGKSARVAELNQPGLYAIANYVDGDTIEVYMNGAIETVRFIGVDTPEIHNPDTPIQCYGQIAANFTKAQISHYGKVRLQADPQDTNRDRYGRLLRYIYLPDGTLLNERLVQQGYGFAYLGFPFTNASLFANDQSKAQAAKSGLWSACHPSINKYGGYSSNPAG